MTTEAPAWVQGDGSLQDRLTLADGRVLIFKKVEGLEQRIRNSGFRVDLENAGGETLVYIKRRSFICGTPWAQFIRVPLIRDDVMMNRRELVGPAKGNAPTSQPT